MDEPALINLLKDLTLKIYGQEHAPDFETVKQKVLDLEQSIHNEWRCSDWS